MKRIYFFIGTTAELIKLAPVISELKERDLDFKIISSNQNKLRFGELDCVFGEQSADYTFRMKPFKWPKNIYLRFFVWIAKSLGNYLIYFRNEFRGDKRKDAVFIVHGDTVTALIGAFVAKLCGVKLVHIESGLRSHNLLEPFPEEISRFIISFFADIHFCSNMWALNNLRSHGGVKVNTFYNTVGESIKLVLKSNKLSKTRILTQKKYFVLVLHRQEHTLFNSRATKEIIELMRQKANDGFKCVFIMHRLTRDYLIKKRLYPKLKSDPNIFLPDRLSYPKFVNLLNRAEFIATDGGSNQEEAYFLGKPCLILRKRTERVEGLGKNALLSGNSTDKILFFINHYTKYRRPKIKLVRKPSKIIVDFLINYYR